MVSEACKAVLASLGSQRLSLSGFVAQMFCEAFVDHGTARTWIMAAGGLNDAGESATHLRYIDVEQGAMWRYLPPLPKKVGYPLTSASLFKFSEATELVLMPGTVEGETMNNPDVMFSYNILTRRFDEVRSRISHAHSKVRRSTKAVRIIN